MNSIYRSILAGSLITGAALSSFVLGGATETRAQTAIGGNGGPGEDGVNTGDRGLPGGDGESVTAQGEFAGAFGGDGGNGGDSCCGGAPTAAGGSGGSGGSANAIGAGSADASGGSGGSGGLGIPTSVPEAGNGGSGGSASASSTTISTAPGGAGSGANATGGAGGQLTPPRQRTAAQEGPLTRAAPRFPPVRAARIRQRTRAAAPVVKEPPLQPAASVATRTLVARRRPVRAMLHRRRPRAVGPAAPVKVSQGPVVPAVTPTPAAQRRPAARGM